MFSDSSEISICVIVKHVQHTGIIKAFCLLGGGGGRGGGMLNLSVPGG